MRRTNILIGLLALSVGVAAGTRFRPSPTIADDRSTPVPWVVAGFASDSLIEIMASSRVIDQGAPAIEVRFPDGSSAPANLTLARYTYESGGHVALPYPFPGPVAYYVDSGTLTLEAIGPGVSIVEVERPMSPDAATEMTVRGAESGMLTDGGRYEVGTGDFVYTLDGVLGPTRNDGDGPLVVLAVFLQPMTGETWGETAGTPFPAP